ncbi:hypothetical protein D1632_02980 [Chryseobacterium nematophagum]|uniref:Uncharacterized protein n=1 Tax=Chryseobacterium nematophagum TaxID=2305228 RepID=A0A3M7LE00_9FLAO|nr:hypothetical protein [Chryseobacterium nematophagum]RMZ60951.1 hypothetical protein D1632_02980 [Chryseobacterium nematophagum]
MKKFLLTVFLSTFSVSIFAQHSDSLIIGNSNKKFFIKGTQTYKSSDYKEVFTNTEALHYIQKSRTQGAISQFFAGFGGGLIGVGLARALSGGDKTTYYNGILIKEKQKGNWGLIGIGIGAVGIGIPLAISANHNLKKAVKAQNQSDRISSNTNSKANYYKINLNKNGICLSYNF